MSKSSKAEKGPATWSDPRYITECEARARRIRVAYVDKDHWMPAILTATWKRDDPEISVGMRMSASSGPKDYFINDVIAQFEESELVEQVALILLNGVTVLIYRVGRFWYDRSKPERRLVKVEVLKPNG